MQILPVLTTRREIEERIRLLYVGVEPNRTQAA